MKKRFVHLRIRTEHSLLNSVIKIASLIKACKSENLKPLAFGMMDDFNMSGALSFSTKLAENGVKPLLGINVCVSLPEVKTKHDRNSTIGLLATSEKGYQNLLMLIKKSQFENVKTSEGTHVVTLENIKEFSDDVICLSGGYNGLIATTFLEHSNETATTLTRSLAEIFGNRLYIELTRHGRTNEKQVEDFLVNLALTLSIPLVATNDVHFFERNKYTAHDIICCIRDQRVFTETDRQKLNEEYYLKSEEEMLELFSDIPEAIENTVKVAQRCSFMLKKHAPMLPSFSNNKEEEEQMFESLCRIGLQQRMAKNTTQITDKEKVYQDRLEYEIKMIKQMGFVGYFLIVCDFVKWAKSQGIPVGPGRGSGAGSIVAWCIEITNIDPIKYGLIFERFLNPDRISMPDFDIDFCQSRRDEVIEYVRKKYGQDCVASIITFGTLQAKAALKDVGRAMQIPYGKIDNICKLIPFNPIEPVTLSKALEIDHKLREESTKDDEIKELIEIALEVEGTYRHSSTHAAGVVIAGIPITQIAPLHKDVNSDLGVVAFNMKDSEAIGLVKFDFLGLKTLTVISDTVKLVKKQRNIEINIDTINLEDPDTLALLSAGKTKGVFQFEATVPKEALQQINVNGIPDLSAITSLNRPGPIDNLPSFLQRKNNKEKIEYPHQMLKGILDETYGIIVYQEQVMQASQILANYTLGQADILRRAMGKKIKSEMDLQHETFTKGAEQNGISIQHASELFAIIEKFAGYGFNKSHAVAYSFITYQTAYLKAHYGAEFYASLMNLDIDNTDKIVETVNDARISGIEVDGVDINKSMHNFAVKGNHELVYALGALKAVGEHAMEEVIKERATNGNFTSIFNFLERCGHSINKRAIESLVLAGAFDRLHYNRLQLKNAIEILAKYSIDLHSKAKNAKKNQVSLFGAEDSSIKTPVPTLPPSEECTITDKMEMEFHAFGFYFSTNPLFTYKEQLKKYHVIESSDLEAILKATGTRDVLMAGVVTKVTQRFSKKGRFAFVTAADTSGMSSYAIFNDGLISAKRDLLTEGKVILIALSARVDEAVGIRLTVHEVLDCIKTLQSVEFNSSLVKNQSQINELETFFVEGIITSIDAEMITLGTNLGSSFSAIKPNFLDLKNGQAILAKVKKINDKFKILEAIDASQAKKDINALATVLDKINKANSSERRKSYFEKKITTETDKNENDANLEQKQKSIGVILIKVGDKESTAAIEDLFTKFKSVEGFAVVLSTSFKKYKLKGLVSEEFFKEAKTKFNAIKILY